jgi:hypothetical protein
MVFSSLSFIVKGHLFTSAANATSIKTNPIFEKSQPFNQKQTTGVV